jgi:Fe-S cluster assembly iron-binding protein IscA
MLAVSDLAVAKVKEYLDDNNIISAVRVGIMSGGCSGPALALALDEKKDLDQVFDCDGVRFLVDNNVTAVCGAIRVDYVEEASGCGCGGSGGTGFAVTSEKPLPKMGGCGGGCSSGSCG